jgi:thioesterase domain-containing protein
VLVPSHYGHALAYVSLAHHLAAARPVLTSDVSVTDDAPTAGRTFEGIARQHLSAIAAARLDGPFLLGGFCFGGAMAYEMARQLSVAGMMPAGLFLLGVSPFDFPGLVPSGAKASWDRSMTLWGKLGRIARVAAGMTTSGGRRYASHELVRRGRTLARITSRAGRERHRSRSRRNARMLADAGHYRGPALDVPVTVILPSWSLSSYWDDPRGLWAGIGSDVDVRVVPGVERMMLDEPIVSVVAEIMTADPGSAAQEPEEP